MYSELLYEDLKLQFYVTYDPIMTYLLTYLLSYPLVDDDPEASFLDLHMYMTSALRKSDVKAVGLQMALELMHEKNNTDVITGLKVKY